MYTHIDLTKIRLLKAWGMGIVGVYCGDVGRREDKVLPYYDGQLRK